MEHGGLLLLIFATASRAFNEAPCSTNGGMCRTMTSPCTNGNYVNGQCPTQAATIKCCIPNQQVSTDCPGIGGSCMSYTSCTGLSVIGLCPGSSATRCCVKPAGIDVIDTHLNREEGGMAIQGYIPSDGSGVTIGTGVDLGQQSSSGLSALGITGTLLSKLRPYLGKTTKLAVHNAGLDEKDLKLTLAEGLALDRAFKSSLLSRIDPYDNRLSANGKAVLASLSHWCYDVTDNNADNKCYIVGCPNYLRDALKGGQGTDATLKAALVQQKTCATAKARPSWVISRLQDEINFI